MNKVIAGIGLLLVILLAGLLFVQTQAQDSYFVLMLVCGGTYDSNHPHIYQASSEGEAQAWADAEMAGAWDIAYIYDSWNTNGNTQLLWVRSESPCYPGMRDWTRF